MQKGRTQDFTVGSIPRHLILFSIPMFAGNLLQALYNTVDSIWVGRFIGAEALGAVSVSFPIIFALVSLVIGIGMATTVMVSQYAGAKQTEKVRRVVSNSLTLLVGAGVLVSLLGIVFRQPILHLINTPPEIFDMASGYLLIFMAGLVFMFVYNVIGAILRGLGDSRTPLIFLIYATVINIILDPLLIFGLGPFPAMGVAGAALATDIAQGISAFLSVRYLAKNLGLIGWNPADYKLDWELTKLTFKIGVPAGIQHTLVSLGILALNSIINTFGKTIVAAYGAAARLDQFAFMPAMSVSLAVSALVGQNLGAGKEERVREIVFWSNILSVTVTMVVALVAIFAPAALLVLFTGDQEVLQAGSLYLRTVGISYLFFSVLFVLQGVMRGAGDTMPTMVITVISLWLVRIPLAKLLSGTMGIYGVWLAIAFSPVIGLTLTWIYYATGRWKNKVVTKPSLEH